MNNPCWGCKAQRIKKENGKYIRCDMTCEAHKQWVEQRKGIMADKVKTWNEIDAHRALEHHRCTTRRRRKAV